MERSESDGHTRSPLARYVPPKSRSRHQGEEVSNGHWVPMSPNYGGFYDHEENHDHHNAKRSVLMKVKEKAKKWRHILAKKKHGHDDGNLVPPWGVSLDEGEEEDPEYHGAPMYESENAPDIYKHASPYQAPASQFISRMHETPGNISGANTTAKESENKQGNDMNMKQQEANVMPQMKTLAKKESEVKQANDMNVKLEEAKVSLSPTFNTDHGIKNKVMHQTVFADFGSGKSDISQMNRVSDKESEMKHANDTYLKPQETKAIPASNDKLTHQLSFTDCDNGGNKKLTEKVAEAIAPAYIMVSEATNMISMKMQGPRPELAKQVWNKVVPMKDYLMNKLEPGDDDRALCHAITEAVSPKAGSPSHADQPGVLSKYKDAISSYLRRENSLGSPIPVSTNPHPDIVEESGRTLQASSN